MEKYNSINAKQLRDFEALANSSCQQLLDTSETITLSKGKTVFEENQHLEKLYCIKKGACKFSKIDDFGQEHILRFLGSGELMGKRALLSNQGAQVTATALTDIELCCLDKAGILDELSQNTQFCRDFMRALIEDVNINEYTRIMFCINKGIKQRLASLLLYIAEKFDVDEQGRLRLRLKREDMAAVLGTSPEYVINLLKGFKNTGLIETERSEIYIKSKECLINLGSS